MIDICQKEVSLYSEVAEEKDEPIKQDLKHILEQELFHNLFLQNGIAIDLNQIKKETDAAYHYLADDAKDFITIVR